MSMGPPPNLDIVMELREQGGQIDKGQRRFRVVDISLKSDRREAVVYAPPS
ncbi:hypothetical protein [Thiohalocapsa halophila]|uniref:hypothetical protein n=1 Tax=Thiohalocapsa halophila TaxID=69359 RepID=UPI001906D9D5|nr:hypothetical protein [Thiohalocapsa halophila]